jgi:hypothetical protein
MNGRKSRAGGPCSFQGLTSRDGRSLTGIGRAVTDSRRLEHGSDAFAGKPDRPPWKGPSWEGQGWNDDLIHGHAAARAPERCRDPPAPRGRPRWPGWCRRRSGEPVNGIGITVAVVIDHHQFHRHIGGRALDDAAFHAHQTRDGFGNRFGRRFPSRASRAAAWASSRSSQATEPPDSSPRR